jgi:aspartyl aminopeptidase
MEHRLVKIEEPMLRVPNLAIHLNRDIYTEGFKVNFQTHMAPLLGLKPKKEGESSSDDKGNNNGGYNNHHHSEFLEKLAKALNCDPSSIRDFDLQLCDVQPSQIGGLNGEFVLSGRLDNLASCYCSLAALVEATTEEKLKKEKGIRALLHFDHEEVGSASTTGAGGSLTDEFVDRVTSAFGNGDADALATARRKSFLVSADMAHAVHPNYADKHEPGHKPKFGDGVVIKHNANQRYSTDAITSFMFKEIGERRKIKSQEFVVRSDLGCGSTIGPILSTRSGIRTVDVGMPQLSMHSIREMCGTEDTRLCVEHFRAVYEDFFEMDEKMIVDGSIGQLCRPCDRFESSPSVGVSSLSDEMKSMSARTYSS